MRFPVASCALVVLTTLGLAGCKSSSSTAQAPSWSFSQLNPFKSSGEAPQYPPKPSSLVSPTGSGNPSAGYAATSDKDAPSFQSATPAGYGNYPNSPSSPLAPSVSYGQQAASTASANPLTTPQQGYYDEGAGYASRGGSVAASRAPSSASASSNPYASLSGDRYASRSFSPSSTTGLYGSPAASPYEAASDRYGSNPSPAAAPYDSSSPYASGASGYGAGTPPTAMSGSIAPYDDSPRTPGSGSSFRRDPYAPRMASTPSPYGAPSTPGSSPYGTGSLPSSYATGATSSPSSPYDTGSAGRYGSRTGTSTSALPNTSVGDRYASAAEATAAATPYSSGQPDYKPGQTGYDPGQTDYAPGVTGYQPPGSSPYQPPASPYNPPEPYATPNSYTSPSPNCCPPSASNSPSAATVDADSHFRPGSTSDYHPASGATGTPIPSITYPSGSSGTSNSAWY